MQSSRSLPAAAVLAALALAPVALAEATLVIGSKAPAIDIKHWVQDRDGAFEPIKEFTPGRVYVVEFWATWCGPCLESMPHLADIQDRYVDKGVTVIGVSDEDLETVEKFLDEKVDEAGDETFRDLTRRYCLTTDPDYSVHDGFMKAAGKRGIPTAFIVGTTGEIEWIGHPLGLDEPLEKIVGGQWDRAEHVREEKDMDAIQKLLFALNKIPPERRAAEALDRIDAVMDEVITEKAKTLLGRLRSDMEIRAKKAAAE